MWQSVKAFFFLICLALAVAAGALWYRHTHHHVYTPPPPRPEVTITIIPGWDLRQVADYFVSLGFASTTADVYRVTGQPALQSSAATYSISSSTSADLGFKLPQHISLEGYLAPETYRVYASSSIQMIVEKLLEQRASELGNLSVTSSDLSVNNLLTLASIVEKEAKTEVDRKLVADILLRRLKAGMPLELDSTVSYAVDRTGTVYTTAKDRAVDSPWNTYKYAGLPPGPICNPSVASIEAVLHPTPNAYWYFLSGMDGEMHYAKTLAEHNLNVVRYLK